MVGQDLEFGTRKLVSGFYDLPLYCTPFRSHYIITKMCHLTNSDLVGNGQYPHIYYNSEGDINNQDGNCKGVDMWEFPIFTNKVYAGVDGPGKDRVLYVAF